MIPWSRVNLATVDEDRIQRVIGRLPDAVLSFCLYAALRFPYNRLK